MAIDNTSCLILITLAKQLRAEAPQDGVILAACLIPIF